MKRRLKIGCVLFLMLVSITSCKKEAGPGGKNTISGTVVYKNGVTGNNDAAPRATIYVAYGTTETTTTFNQIIVSDDEGKFLFEGLNKGDYFIKAGFTDAHGFNYTTSGYGLSVKTKKENMEVNIILE